MTPLEHALDFAARGLPVVPCRPSGDAVKRPYIPRDKDADGNPIPNTGGVAKATTDPEQIRAWWTQWPSALIGGAMGRDLRLLAIDPDVPKQPGDADGLAAWNALVAEHGGIPATHAHETPSGGRHYIFRMPEGLDLGNREGALKGTGINVRGSGGYLIMAPSRLADGRAYRLADDFDFWTFAPAPQWLLDLIVDAPESVKQPVADPKPSRPPQESPRAQQSDALSHYVAAAVEKECAEVASCTKGRRNIRLNDAAFAVGTLVGASVLGRSEAERRLWDAAAACGHVKDEGRAATLATIKSGLDGGEKKPRDLSKVKARQERRRQAPIDRSAEADPDPNSPGNNVPLISEDEAGILFAEQYRGKLRFCVDHGSWFKWDGHIWRQNRTGLAFHHARELVRRMAETEAEKVRIAAGRAAFAGAVERYARADIAFATTAEAWDRDPWLLGTPGGTVDLRTGDLRAARPDEGLTKSTAVSPSAEADCPLWRKFISETFGGDVDVIAFAQRWAGYGLTGLIREHALVFGHGDGGNGKGVFVNTHVGIMNDYAVTSAMETFIASANDRHSTELAMLRGARMVTASETEEGRQWAEARIKALTGGDRITARFMRMDNFTYLPTFKLLIVGNHKPGLRNVDEAMRRRFNLLPFLNKPVVKDLELEERLKAEWPGILRWMIEGCQAWQRDGLTPPESVRDATAAYFEDQDVFGEWLAERCIVDRSNPHRQVTTAELFASWSAYSKAANEPAGTEKALAQKLEKEGFVRKEKVPNFSGMRLRGFLGIEVRPDADHRRAAE